MINQLLCFPDGNSVVPFLRSLISVCLITWPWSLPFPNICVGLHRDLRLHSGFCSALRSSRPQSLVSDRSHREPRWLFISFYCIFTYWPGKKQKRISL